MQLTDYYSILGVAPSASREDIKKAYRKLALQFHPDKHINDKQATVRFSAIKEAYETLSDPAKKNTYLQQRWYAQSLGIKKGTGIVTPEAILEQLLLLDKYVSRMDSYRMPKERIFSLLESSLSESNIEKINAYEEITITNEVAHLAYKISKLLEHPQRQAVLLKIHALTIDQDILLQIMTEEKKLQQAARWERKKTGLILLAVAAICLIIYFASN